MPSGATVSSPISSGSWSRISPRDLAFQWPRGGNHRLVFNDYLGMGQNPDVIAAFQNAAGKMGSGAGGTATFPGTSNPLVELQWNWPTCTTRKRPLVFTSGFVSNEASISTIASCCPIA